MAAVRAFCRPSYSAIALHCGKKLAVVKSVNQEVGNTHSETLVQVHTVPIPSSPTVVCTEVSPSGGLLGACTDDKKVWIWDSEKLELKWERVVPKRPVAIAFTHSETTALVADKSGDVWRFSLDGEECSEGQLLLGHVSMLLDLAVTADDRFVITADRDEKIRVSCFPNAYNIHTFCLGHTELVSKVCLCPCPNTTWMVSGSSDSTVCLWDYTTGTLLDSVALSNKRDKNAPAVTGLAFSQVLSLVVVAHDKSPSLLVYNLTNEGKLVLCCTTEMAAEICHFDFHPIDNTLWVLLGCEENPIINLEWTGNKFVQPKDWSDNEIAALIRSSDLLKDIRLAIPDYQQLKKKEFDNLSPYFQKKEERMAKLQSSEVQD